jgi:hypothetical protein
MMTILLKRHDRFKAWKTLQWVALSYQKRPAFTYSQYWDYATNRTDFKHANEQPNLMLESVSPRMVS